MKRRTSKDLDTLLQRRFSNELTSNDLQKPKWCWVVLPDGTAETIDMIQFILAKYKKVMTGWRKVNNQLQYIVLWKETINEQKELSHGISNI